MVSWAVTGATRGIGLGFIDHISADPQNQVFALIRSLSTAGQLKELAETRGNIHVLVTDIADPKKLEQTASEVAKATGGSLDFLILNAGSTTHETAQFAPAAFLGKENDLQQEVDENLKHNLFSNVYTINAFLSLIRKGQNKRILFVSSMSGDVEFTRITNLPTMVGYSIAKGGMNMVIAKYATELAPDGIRVVSSSPGWVATDAAEAVTGDPEVRKFMLNAFHKIDPNVEGPIPIEESVSSMVKVARNLTQADSGKFLSHHGDVGTWF